MQLIGASGTECDPVFDALEAAAARRTPYFVWSDGADITAVVGEAGDSVDDVMAFALRVIVPDGH